MGVSLQQQSLSLQTARYVNRIGYDRDQKRLKRKRAGLGCRFAWTLGTMCWMAVKGRVNCPPPILGGGQVPDISSAMDASCSLHTLSAGRSQ